ncbi:DUF5615 family PIN-like protein [Nonomuraea rhodomycinica]|uniref:DUF5615 family PIN-like protein n=1 Tax=Nonomuraea rhodomycinica TaxID=1712872 RepID=A0A7Y6MAF9_9ACTN|nr:DUF5615 family PIN-like protein [Nonomuraea rhodomycinica]
MATLEEEGRTHDFRSLVDENLSQRVAELLTKAGHDAVHVRDLQATSAPDTMVMSLAVAEQRVIVSADTDFGFLSAEFLESVRGAFLLTWSGTGGVGAGRPPLGA